MPRIPVTPKGPRPPTPGTGLSNPNEEKPGRDRRPGEDKRGGLSAAERRAAAADAKYRAEAAARYTRQAKNLEAQAAALRHALNVDFQAGLQQKLENINLVLRQGDADLMSGYRKRVRSLEGSVKDNEQAQATQTLANNNNRIRERADALTEVMAQGGGESDAMAAQMMSLRNWQANQSEVVRSNFDTLRSINSSLTDLNVDTATNRKNLEVQALADKEMLWTNYYNQRSEAWTALGNTRGQQADYYDMAKEYGGKGDGGAAVGAAANAFMQGSKELGKSWENPGLSKRLRRWDGREEFEPANTNSSLLHAAPTVSLGERPEGATLRSW